MLYNAGDLEPDVILGEVGPRMGAATVEKVAINAVMAGCDPDVFPIVMAAVEAVSDPVFGLGPIQVTTHAITPFVVVNGPAGQMCGVSSGVGCLGPGYAANATIGRALRFVLINIGGGVPGVGDMATVGSPAKFSFCMAEAEEDSPFEPLHVSQGFKTDDSTVTVLGCEAPHSVFCNYDAAEDPDTFLRILAAAMCNPGSNNIHIRTGTVAAVLNPLHAKPFAREGWSRAEVQRRLWEHAYVTRGALRKVAGVMVEPGDDDEHLHVVPEPEDFMLLVGGEEGGTYSAWMPSWCGGDNGQIPVTKRIRFAQECEVPPSVR
jgi:hypothetical protein